MTRVGYTKPGAAGQARARKVLVSGVPAVCGGDGAPTWVLTVSSQGKTRICLGEQRVGEAKRMVANYRRLLGLVEEVCELNLEWLRAGRVRRRPPARPYASGQRLSPELVACLDSAHGREYNREPVGLRNRRRR